MKLCKDCKFCEVKNGDFTFARCSATEGKSSVTGEATYMYCETQRVMIGAEYCGPDGRLFELDNCDVLP